MALTLLYHPLSSFAWKALIALYEKDLAFEPRMVDFGDADSTAELRALWPMTKIPVLVDKGRGRIVAEVSIIIEYLDLHHPDAIGLIPEDADEALEVRLMDRILDLHVHQQMQKIVGDRLRPKRAKDPAGVEQARATLRTAYDMLEPMLASRHWAAGPKFTMADCAAPPALFYANKVEPFEASHPNVAAYLQRLKDRPSFARVLKEAEPYFNLFPG